MKINKVIFFSVSAMMLLTSSAFAAFSVSPARGEIVLKSKDKKTPSTSLTLQNGTGSSAIDITIVKRTVNAEGEITESPLSKSDDKIEVYPRQLILKDGESRDLRFSYKGPRDVKEEILYVAKIRKIPMKLDKAEKKKKEGSKIAVVVVVAVGISIVPEEAMPDIFVVKTEPKTEITKSKQSFNGVTITLGNKGNRSFLVEKYEVEVNYVNSQGKTVVKTVKSTDHSNKEEIYDKTRARIFAKSKGRIFISLADTVKEVKDVSIRELKK